MRSIVNKILGSIVRIGVSASSTASALSTNEPKRPEKLK